MELGEIKLLAEEHDVRVVTVQRLIDGGVEEDDLSEVLDMRNVLSFPGAPGEPFPIVSVKAMVRAYNTAGGDVEVLSSMVDEASNVAGQVFCREWAGKGRGEIFGSRYTIAMSDVADRVEQEGVGWLGEGVGYMGEGNVGVW
jgi:hypothetical protein